MQTSDYRVQIEQWARRVQDTNNHLYREAQCSKAYSRNDHLTRVDRWKENLSLKQVENLKPLIVEGADRFNYKLPSK